MIQSSLHSATCRRKASRASSFGLQIRFALLAALGGPGGSNLIKLVFLSLVSGIFLADAPIALVLSSIRIDLPCIELSINFAFKTTRAVALPLVIQFFYKKKALFY